MRAHHAIHVAWMIGLVFLLGCASQGTTPGTEGQQSSQLPAEYEEGDILRAAEDFFGEGAAGLADVLSGISNVLGTSLMI